MCQLSYGDNAYLSSSVLAGCLTGNPVESNFCSTLEYRQKACTCVVQVLPQEVDYMRQLLLLPS